MKKILSGSTLVVLFAFVFSGCNLLTKPVSKDASTQTPSTQEGSTSFSDINPEEESVKSAQNDQELLQLLENMDDPSFGDDLNTLESGLR